MKTGLSLAAAILSAAVATAAHADTDNSMRYQVSITNITKGMSFTPFLAATHNKNAMFFKLGEAPSDELAHLAEAGDIGPMMTLLQGSNAVYALAQTEGLLGPGESVEFEIETSPWFKRFGYLSLAAMLVPTNDTFVSLNQVVLPYSGSITYLAQAYDAGSETNTEMCDTVPGPVCGGEAYSPDDAGEGYVYPSPAIHGEAELNRAAYNWEGPVAKVTISRMR